MGCISNAAHTFFYTRDIPQICDRLFQFPSLAARRRCRAIGRQGKVIASQVKTFQHIEICSHAPGNGSNIMFQRALHARVSKFSNLPPCRFFCVDFQELARAILELHIPTSVRTTRCFRENRLPIFANGHLRARRHHNKQDLRTEATMQILSCKSVETCADAHAHACWFLASLRLCRAGQATWG